MSRKPNISKSQAVEAETVEPVIADTAAQTEESENQTTPDEVVELKQLDTDLSDRDKIRKEYADQMRVQGILEAFIDPATANGAAIKVLEIIREDGIVVVKKTDGGNCITPVQGKLFSVRDDVKSVMTVYGDSLLVIVNQEFEKGK